MAYPPTKFHSETPRTPGGVPFVSDISANHIQVIYRNKIYPKNKVYHFTKIKLITLQKSEHRVLRDLDKVLC